MKAQVLLVFIYACSAFAVDDVTTFLSQLAIDDVNRATGDQVVLNYQDQASSKNFSHDNAKDPLFKSVDPALLQKPTYAALTSLYAFYTLPDASVADPNSAARTATANDFIDTLNQTKVFLEGWNYLQSLGLASSSYDSYKQQLFSLWFTVYAREAAAGSSGFETVFVGEYLDIDVIGLTNWVRFQAQEQINGVDYHGWFAKQPNVQIKLQFGLEESGAEKQAMSSSLLLDTSPEFEIVAYSVCALAAQGTCKYTYAGNEVILNVATRNVNGVTVIDTASPSIGSTSATTVKPTKAPPVVQVAFQELVDEMWAADAVNRATPEQYLINWGNKVDSKSTPSGQKLLSNVDESVFTRPVYSVLTTIYNNNILVADVCVNESDYTRGIKASMFRNVLDTWGNTSVFPLMHDYLVSVGVADPNVDTFKSFLYNFWFAPYSRCSDSKMWGSSGFEHVFSGESRSGSVDGQHDWMRYYLLEKVGNISYYGYYSYDGQLTGTFEYDWLSDHKKEGGFLFGTSPVFDFSLFTACVLTQEGESACRFTLDGYDLAVTSYTQECATGGLCLATSYPVDEV